MATETDRKPQTLTEALDYFRPHRLTGDGATIILTAGKMREALAVIEAEFAALRSEAGAGAAMRESEPPPGLLMSMAIRYDHGLGVPGHYDQAIFRAEPGEHARRLASTLSTMRQLWEEVSGNGFYSPAREAEYVEWQKRSEAGRRSLPLQPEGGEA